MMIRTQIYLPEEVHNDLMNIAELHNTSMSELIRQGARNTIRNHAKKKKNVSQVKQKNGLAYFANPPKTHLFRSSISAIDLVRAERD